MEEGCRSVEARVELRGAADGLSELSSKSTK